jgi:dihydrofolate reductase
MIRLIAAIDQRRGMATDEGIPWHLPEDAAYFRDQTTHGLVVMGSATYREFAEPLHDRDNYVMTTHQHPLRDGFRPIATLDDVIRSSPGEDVWVIGGAFVFADTLGRADELFLTQVLADFHCTKVFPEYSASFSRFDHSADHEDGGVSYRFEKWRQSEPGSSTGSS